MTWGGLPMDDGYYPPVPNRCVECDGWCQDRYERCDDCLVTIARCFNAVDRAVKNGRNRKHRYRRLAPDRQAA